MHPDLEEQAVADRPGTHPAASASHAICKWTVVAHDRIMGVLHTGEGRSTGKSVITSPVLQVVLAGPEQVPVALTRSGSAYWLGEPAAQFGNARARSFVEAKSALPQPGACEPDPTERTVIQPLQD